MSSLAGVLDLEVLLFFALPPLLPLGVWDWWGEERLLLRLLRVLEKDEEGWCVGECRECWRGAGT